MKSKGKTIDERNKRQKCIRTFIVVEFWNTNQLRLVCIEWFLSLPSIRRFSSFRMSFSSFSWSYALHLIRLMAFYFYFVKIFVAHSQGLCAWDLFGSSAAATTKLIISSSYSYFFIQLETWNFFKHILKLNSRRNDLTKKNSPNTSEWRRIKFGSYGGHRIN